MNPVAGHGVLRHHHARGGLVGPVDDADIDLMLYRAIGIYMVAQTVCFAAFHREP